FSLPSVMLAIGAEQLRLNTGKVLLDHIDKMTVGKCGQEEKVTLIAQELSRHILKHGSMVLEWGSGVAWLTAWCKLVVALDNTEEEAIMQVHVGNGEEIVSMRPGGAKGDNKADEDSDTAEVGDDTAMGDNETKPAHE
ncbi:hypothetical protein MJO29_008251, partial [Puccinia striiformis f. sp. tritici]